MSRHLGNPLLHSARQSGWLLIRFSQREISNRFAGSLLGGVWSAVHPVALLLIYTFVFTTVFKARALTDESTPFVVFLAVALWPWMAFQEAVLRGTTAVVSNAALIKKVRFAHELLVYAAVAASFVLQLFGWVIALTLLAVWGTEFHWTGVPRALAALGGIAILATGLALLLGAVHVFVRDLEHGVAHALMVVFYLSPVLYSAAMVPDWMKSIMLLNPVAVLIEAARSALLAGQAAPDWPELVALACCLGLLALGRAAFRRLSPHFEEAL